LVPTTDHNVSRGTLAFKLDGHRVEITTFRAGDPAQPLADRIEADLGGRDMTIGALAWWLTEDRILDPFDGLEHWRTKRIEPVGDAAARILEHPVRWLRYYRKAHTHRFALGQTIRKARPPIECLDRVPREALAAEFRGALLDTPSPGRLLLEWHEAGLLDRLTPSLARQFWPIPAGPQRYHPEVSQALHMILSLEWAVARTPALAAEDRLAVLVAVLCHDLGKGYTPESEWPAHRGHEGAGVRHVSRLLASLPGLADPKARRLAEQVCALHLDARRLRTMRPGTLARHYERWFKDRAFPVQLFALAVGADSGGRLDLQAEGDATFEQVRGDLEWIRERCGSVDAAALRERFPDTERFRSELHEARCRALRSGPGTAT